MAGQQPTFADAGPLIVFARARSLRVLQQLFGIVHITRAVKAEVLPGQGRAGEVEICAAIAAGHIREVEADPPIMIGLRDRIDDGEVTTIEAGFASPGSLVLLDDIDARIVAVRSGLRVSGTLGILLLGKQRGLIPSVSGVLERLIGNGFYVSQELIRAVITKAGEPMPEALGHTKE